MLLQHLLFFLKKPAHLHVPSRPGAEGAETSETLGGLIYEAAGNVPSQGDTVEVADFQVTVEEVTDQRLIMVLMKYGQDLPGFAKGGESNEE